MKRGLPRPLVKVEGLRYTYEGNWGDRRFPYPYSADESGIADISTGRLAECVKFKRCLVCGEVVEGEDVGLLLYAGEPNSGYKYWDVVHKESGPFHFTCLDITVRMCPHVAETGRFFPGIGEWSVVKPMIMQHFPKRSK